MKILCYYLRIVIVSLFVALVLYPAIHEIGHVIFVVLFGGVVVDFNIFPLPNIVCDISAVSTAGKVLIGLGGMMLTSATFFIKPLRNFWIWYMEFVMKLICEYALVLSVVAVISDSFGLSWSHEDVIQVIEFILSIVLMILYHFNKCLSSCIAK